MFSGRSLAAALTVLLLGGTAHAWEGHSRLRRLALEDMEALRALPAVPVTPLSVEVHGINPATEFGFQGASPGEQQTPFDILVTYAQEPDWGMDRNLRVSWKQRFMGGYEGLSSQGYFHMYYPAATLHLPFPVTSMGVAPKRAEQWAEMGRQAFARGDSYWGWRFTAWSFHYLEDLTQPYHSTQTHRRFIRLRSPIKGTTNCTSNFHLTFERWMARRLEDEDQGRNDFGLVAALKSSGEFRADSLKKAVQRVAKGSHKGFGNLAGECIAYFGEKFLSSEKVEATEEDLDRVDPGPQLEKIMAISRRYFELAGRALRAATRQVMEQTAAPGSVD